MASYPVLPATVLGNIDLSRRPSVPNPEGGYSTVFSESGGLRPDGPEMLYPRVVDGRILSSDEAWQHALNTGETLGIYPNVASADAAGQQIHRQQERAPMIKMLLDAFKF